MKKHIITRGGVSLTLLAAFALWTWLVRTVDVQAVGPQESTVGFAALNTFVHELTGVHFTLYTVTDWLGLVPFAICAGFGCLGLWQWIRRKSLWKVDRDLFVLGGFYGIVIAAYLLFETVVINYRPVLIDGVLEVSYPSSTTLLVLCVIPTTMMQLRARLQTAVARRTALTLLAAFAAFMVIGRVIAGVHWASDIVGGILLSGGLVMLYDTVVCAVDTKKRA